MPTAPLLPATLNVIRTQRYLFPFQHLTLSESTLLNYLFTHLLSFPLSLPVISPSPGQGQAPRWCSAIICGLNEPIHDSLSSTRMKPSTKIKKQPRKEESGAAGEGRSNQEKSRREGGPGRMTRSSAGLRGGRGIGGRRGRAFQAEGTAWAEAWRRERETAVTAGVT